MKNREEHLVQQMYSTSARYYAWLGLLAAAFLLGLVAYAIQVRKGLIVTGLRDQVSWGIYISSFVFWVGVSKGGTMISAILRVTNAEWRTPMTRLSEAITVLALITGAPMIIADLGRPDRIWNLVRYGRIQSPLIWDFLSVMTYLTACIIYFYLPLIPDLAILAGDTRFPEWRRKIYRALSLNWRNTPEQHQLLERAIHMMAIIVIPLAISVHTVVSWIFAMTLRPGWNSTIYGPYFVVGAIYSGGAAVLVAMWALRRAMHLEDYIQPVHFRKLGKLLLASTLVYLYFNINEYLTVGYKLEGFERDLVESLFIGRYAKMFWSVQLLGVILPIAILMIFLLLKRLECFSVGAVGISSLLIVLGAWVKRFLIVVPTLETPFLPAQRIPAEWTHYSPTWIEWAIVAGALGGFLLAYSLVAKFFPIVSIWETREHDQPVEQLSERRLETKLSPAPTVAITVFGLLALLFAPSSSAGTKPKEPPKPAAIGMSYQVMEQNQEKPASTAIAPGTIGTLENPFASRHSREEAPIPAVLVSAKLTDALGAPLAFKPVSFSVRTYFGTLSLGNRPTGADGVAKMKITDRRFGTYTVSASFAGDESAAGASNSLEVTAAPRAAPGLPEQGMLITPYPTFWITLPFALFFGSMWVVFAYVAILVSRARKLGIVQQKTG
jgi:molybdopterin-containing oxidoreductase family membrane subunit